MPTGLTDLEITRACAKAMGYRIIENDLLPGIYCGDLPPRRNFTSNQYDPLHDDAQAMALVKRFRINIDQDKNYNDGVPFIAWARLPDGGWHSAPDLNRAICLCVAALAQEREGRG